MNDDQLRESERRMVEWVDRGLRSGRAILRDEIYDLVRAYKNEYARNQENYDESQAR